MNSLKKKLRKIRRQKRLFELLYLIFAFVLPVVFTYLYVPTITFNPAAISAITFDSRAILSNNISRVSFSLSFITTICFVVINGVKYIKERLEQMPFSTTKQIFYFFKGAMIPFVIIAINILLESILHGLIRGLQLTLILNAVFLFIANCIVKLFLNFYDYEEAKRIQKNTMIEALRENDDLKAKGE